jgi:type VI protein secretion system component Hcp
MAAAALQPDAAPMFIRTLAGRLTYANVTSTACLFVALGGSAYAATSITGADVKNGSLTSADIKDHTLRARDFKAGQLPRGARGPQGERGPAGERGAAGQPGGQVSPAPPPISRDPVGRLVLPGVSGSGPGGAIEVRTMSWSSLLTAGGTAGGGITPKPQWGDVEVTKDPDGSSGQLWKLAASGKSLATAKLELLKPDSQTPYATYVFKNVSIRKFSTEGSGTLRRDTVSLRFAPTPSFAFDAGATIPAVSEPRVGSMTADGIAGESALVLDAWNIGAADPSTIGPFVVSKPVDSASSGWLGRFASGQHIKKVTIKLLQPGSANIATTYVLSDVVVASFGVIGDGRPLERLGLDAARVESTTPVPGGGTVRSCWDRKLNASC